MAENMFNMSETEINKALDKEMRNEVDIKMSNEVSNDSMQLTENHGYKKRKDNLNKDVSYEVIRLEDLKENNLNAYIYLAQEDKSRIEGLKESIRINGLIHPLVCKKTKECYTLLSGHLRKVALEELVKEGLLQFQEVKVKVVNVSDEDELEYLLDANVVKRHKTDYSKMMEVRGYSSIYEKLKENDEIPTGLTANIYIANKMQMSQRQIAKYMHIKNNLHKEDINDLVNNQNMSLENIYSQLKKYGDAFEEEYFSKKGSRIEKMQKKEEQLEPMKLLVKENNAIAKVLKDLERINTSNNILLESDNLYKIANKKLKRYTKSAENYAMFLNELLDTNEVD